MGMPYFARTPLGSCETAKRTKMESQSSSPYSISASASAVPVSYTHLAADPCYIGSNGGYGLLAVLPLPGRSGCQGRCGGLSESAVHAVRCLQFCGYLCLRDVYKRQIMSDQFKRLGVIGDFEHPYLTLKPEFEARQIEVLSLIHI